MRALVYDAFGAPPRVTDLPDPVAPAGGAVVRVHSTGLCRSDWHGWMGHDSDIVTFPHTPGHELAGVVESVGSGVDGAWVGRAVTAPFVLACGDCPTCVAGEGQVCPHQRQPGFTAPGSFAERVVVHAAATNFVTLPADLPPSAAAGLGCRVATAHRAVVTRGRLAPDDTVVVFGCGGVGLAAIQVAAGRGARVLGVDLDAGSRALARDLGAEEVLDGALPQDELVAAVADWSGGGAHLSVDAVGSPATCRTGVLALRRRGRHVQVGLLPPAAGRADVPMERVIGWELDVLGSHGMAAADYPALLADVAAGRLDLAALVAPGEPEGLEAAASLLPRMGETPSRGMVLIDPAR